MVADGGSAEDWLRTADRPAAALTWLDCLPTNTIAAARAEAKALVHQPGGGCTFWMDNTRQPRCALERLAAAVLRFHVAREPGLRGGTPGVELWVQVRSSEEPMSIHWDCDEERKGRTGDHVPPCKSVWARTWTATDVSTLGLIHCSRPIMGRPRDGYLPDVSRRADDSTAGRFMSARARGDDARGGG